MKQSLLIVAALLVAALLVAASAAFAGNDTMAVEPYTFTGADFQAQPWASPLTPMFESAAAQYNVPIPLLLTLGYYGSAFENRGAAPTVEGGYGVMALRKNVLGADSLGLGASLTGDSEDALKTDPSANISACAAVLDNYARKWQIDRGQGLVAWLQPVIDYAGLDPENSRFFACEVFRKLAAGLEVTNTAGETFAFSPQDIGSVDLGSLLPKAAAVQSPDYPPAIWNPAADCNFDTAIHPSDCVVWHTMEGSLAGAISWFQNCSATASAHYCVGQDGTVVQMVREDQTAWTESCYNYRSIGIEQEGYAASATHPKALYDATSALTRSICDRHGIPKQHSELGPGILGHIDITNHACGTHWDPGMNWDWNYCMQQVCQASPNDQVYIEPRGQNSSYYSDDGSAYWGDSSTFCNSFDSNLTSGGSRVFPTATASPSGHWIQARPVLAIPGGMYQIDVAHAGPTHVSSNIKTSMSLTNAIRVSALSSDWTNVAFQSANSCQWDAIGLIQLNQGVTQPTVKLTYYSGSAGDTSHQWSVEAIRFTSIPTPSNLTLTACPSVGGTVDGAGVKSAGDSITVTATPNPGYNFVSWTTGSCGGTVVSTSASYTFNIPGQNYALYANFAATGPVLTATACTGGTASGGGVLLRGHAGYGRRDGLAGLYVRQMDAVPVWRFVPVVQSQLRTQHARGRLHRLRQLHPGQLQSDGGVLRQRHDFGQRHVFDGAIGHRHRNSRAGILLLRLDNRRLRRKRDSLQGLKLHVRHARRRLHPLRQLRQGPALRGFRGLQHGRQQPRQHRQERHRQRGTEPRAQRVGQPLVGAGSSERQSHRPAARHRSAPRRPDGVRHRHQRQGLL